MNLDLYIIDRCVLDTPRSSECSEQRKRVLWKASKGRSPAAEFQYSLSWVIYKVIVTVLLHFPLLAGQLCCCTGYRNSNEKQLNKNKS